MDERPAVQVEGARPEVAGKPREAREHHQRPDAAPAAPLPGDDAARHEDEADDGVGHDELDIARVVRGPFGCDGDPGRRRKERKPQPSARAA